jgi:hypothetical protein
MKYLVVLAISSVAFGQSADGQPETVSLSETLTTECYSHLDRRAQLGPLRTDSTNPEVLWQSGYVRSGEKWIPFESAVEHAQQDPAQIEYEQLSERPRNKHVRLAKWALRNDRVDQYRTHMLAATISKPGLLNAATLQRMGLQQFDGVWISPEEAQRALKKYQEFQKSFQIHGDRILRIRDGLLGSGRDRAKADLAEITSPDAVEAIYQILGSSDAVCQRMAAESLARIDSTRSTLRLTQFALASPLESVQTIALEALRGRSKETFIPPLLDLLVKVHSETGQSMSGNFFTGLEFHFQSFMESRSTVAVRNSSVKVDFWKIDVPDPESGGMPDFRGMGLVLLPKGRARIMNRSFASLVKVQHAQRTANYKHEANQTNKQILAVLNATTDEASNDPSFWWAWWNRYADVDAPVKEVLEVERHFEERQMLVTVSASCFTAGTPVLTETGLRPIESLRIGDRVLSQDIDTAELRFRAVQQTTIRPPRKTYTINFSSEPIRCTGGHNFWKAGTGWVKARDLEVGDRIRTPTGTEAVTAVATSGPAKTYNLVVEGFHTYFVGESKLLVQDVLPITPTDNVLPGFNKFELGNDRLGEDN